jgi:glycosyltransferase involved in cell wall biosynthesis
VVYGYQPVANELSSIIGWLVGAKVVWGIRASNSDHAQYGWPWHLTFRVGVLLSRFADLIIANSEAGARYFEGQGYPADRIVVIPNGINTELFAPDRAAGQSLRLQWGLSATTPVVGIVARLDPIKDHETFLRAAALVHNARPDVRFVCVGDGDVTYRRQLLDRTRALGLETVVHWTGTDHRVTAVMSAFDVLCSSSLAEGFSNVVGEAMACGTPCVVTDVGDSAGVVADCGTVVPPSSPEALSDALLSLLALEPERLRLLGTQARKRVAEHFSVPRLVARTMAALEMVA